MHSVTINLTGERDAWPDIFDPRSPVAGKVTHLPAVGMTTLGFAILPEYTEQKRPGVAIRVNLPNGHVVVADTTLAMFLTAADAFKARYGDPRVDKHDGVVDPDVYRHKKHGGLWVHLGYTEAYGSGERLALMSKHGEVDFTGNMKFMHVPEAKLREKFDRLSKHQVQDELRRLHLKRSLDQK